MHLYRGITLFWILGPILLPETGWVLSQKHFFFNPSLKMVLFPNFLIKCFYGCFRYFWYLSNAQDILLCLIITCTDTARRGGIRGLWPPHPYHLGVDYSMCDCHPVIYIFFKYNAKRIENNIYVPLLALDHIIGNLVIIIETCHKFGRGFSFG
jgi:hypothetical protein